MFVRHTGIFSRIRIHGHFQRNVKYCGIMLYIREENETDWMKVHGMASLLPYSQIILRRKEERCCNRKCTHPKTLPSYFLPGLLALAHGYFHYNIGWWWKAFLSCWSVQSSYIVLARWEHVRPSSCSNSVPYPELNWYGLDGNWKR